MQQNSEFINFRKERDLGEIISDTFAFVKYNYKTLFKVIYKNVGPIMLVTLIAYLVYNLIFLKGSEGFFSAAFEENLEDITSRFAITFLIGMLFMMVTTILFYSIFYATINYSIQSYVENKGEIDENQVTENIKQNWSKFFRLALLAGIMLFFGFIFFMIPGIYLFVPLSLVFSIMIFHNLGVLDSISYSFKLVKRNWWISFFTLFLITIIYYIGSSVFQIPAMIYTFIKTMIFATSESDISLNSIYDWPYLILNFLGSLVQFLLYGFVIITTVLIFFNLDEKLNKTGAFEIIENLGKRE